MVGCIRKLNHIKYAPRLIQCRNYNNYSPEALNTDIKKINWSDLYHMKNVNLAVAFLNVNLENIFNKHAPLITKKIKGRVCPWLNRNVKSFMNDRDKILRKARKSKNSNDWERYRKLRNKCNTMLKAAKSKYYKDTLDEHSLNPKKFWKTLKEIFPSKSKGISFSSIETDSNKIKANIFCNYFSNVVNDLKSKVCSLSSLCWRLPVTIKPKTHKVFKFHQVSKSTIEKHLLRLKKSKSTGLDGLPPALLKDSASALCHPLCYIINLTLSSGIIPSIWKTAKITPVHKSGPVDNPDNYRPISILPALSKIMEKVVYDQLMDYLESNSLLSSYQFGFRAKRSTKLATTLFVDDIRFYLDSGNLVGAVFIDLKKAFDTIGHSVLLSKLSAFGIFDIEHKWFTDYLFDRKQLVNINNTFSESIAIKHGVPQGSILGPRLFITFFDDLADILQYSKIVKYADDTVIYYGDNRKNK